MKESLFFNKKGVAVIAMILFAVTAVIGLVLINVSRQVAAKAEAIRSWPTTSGTITVAKTVTKTTGTGTERRTYLAPYVEYKYSVGGEEYTGSRISIGPEEVRSVGIDIKGAEVKVVDSEGKKAIKKYSVGKEIPVYYNPDNPKDTVLEPYAPSGSNVLLIAGIAFGIVGALGAVSSFFKEETEFKAG